jgi:hypothetical protein
MYREFAEDLLLGGTWDHMAPGGAAKGERSAGCFQDTLKTSMSANRLSGTAD